MPRSHISYVGIFEPLAKQLARAYPKAMFEVKPHPSGNWEVREVFFLLSDGGVDYLYPAANEPWPPEAA